MDAWIILLWFLCHDTLTLRYGDLFYGVTDDDTERTILSIVLQISEIVQIAGTSNRPPYEDKKRELSTKDNIAIFTVTVTTRIYFIIQRPPTR